MASSKKRQTKKVVKKVKKNKFLGFLVFVVIIVVLVLGGMSYVKLNKINNELEKVNLDYIPSEIYSPVDFKIPSVDGVEFNLDLNEKFFPTLSEVKRPSHSEGDAIMSIFLYGNVKLNPIDKIVNSIFKLNLEHRMWSRIVKVMALEATDSELITECSETISLPNTVYTDLLLRTESVAYDGVTLSWETSDPLIITSDGVVTGIGSCKLTCRVKKGTDEVIKEFNITTAIPSDIVLIDYDFNSGYSDSTYVNTDNYLDIELTGAISKNGSAVFRVKKDTEVGEINTKYYENLKEIKFSYNYSDTGGFTKNTDIELLISNDKENYTSLKKETLTDGAIHDFKYSFDDIKDGYLKIKISTEYAERFIAIDDLYIARKFDSSDVEEALRKTIPTKISKSYDFPYTSPYGGKVSYTSSDESVLSKLGVVQGVEETKTVMYHVEVSGFDFSVSFDVEIKVVTKSTAETLEIRFIDLNKNGGNSDCGESTYIRIGSIDVLIDAGDNYTQTFENIKECINTYSLDKELDYVIATHPDSDHIGSMDSVINEFKVLHLITFVENDGDTTGVFKDYKSAYTSEGCEVCYVTDSYNNQGSCKRRIELSPDVYIDIINTTYYELDANATNDNNGRSIVCVLNAYGTRVLFTGDAENLGRDIESATKDEIGNVDILKVVHHGTKNGCSEEYLKVIDPEVAIICNGNYLGNKHGHPTYEAISSLYKYDANMKVYTITGGKGGSDGACEKGSSYVCSGNKDNYDFDRNGMITIIIGEFGYLITSENFGENPKEIKDTEFFKEMKNAYN